MTNTEPLRLHVYSLPWAMTTREYSWCAYTMKVRKFCDMMTARGHEVILYAGEENEAACAEHVVTITRREQGELLGTRDAPWNFGHPLWVAFNHRAIAETASRQRDRDLLLLITGAQRPIADALPRNQAVEFGVGYAGVFADFKVFESYAWMHSVLAARHGTTDWDVTSGLHPGNTHWYDAVIPNFFEPSEFHVREPSDYYLFIGRGIRRKGAWIAADVCRHLDAPLFVAGDDLGGLPEYGTRIGTVGPEERARLLSGAIATFVPTTYCEPFGGVAVESLLSGTPVICTDHGAFTETIRTRREVHPLEVEDGWRCHTLAEFAGAAEQAAKEAAAEHVLDLRTRRRVQALQRFSLEAVAPRYEEYLRRVRSLWDGSWADIESPNTSS